MAGMEGGVHYGDGPTDGPPVWKVMLGLVVFWIAVVTLSEWMGWIY